MNCTALERQQKLILLTLSALLLQIEALKLGIIFATPGTLTFFQNSRQYTYRF